jgi:hypothetical protein
MERIAVIAIALSACGGRYKAPPSVPNIPMPSGAALKPFDASNSSLARPAGIHVFNGLAYVSLGNYDGSYTVRGPGMLAVVAPATGAVSTIDIGGASGKQCLEPLTIGDAGGKLYVGCSGYKDFSDPQSKLIGIAIVEADPGTGAVTRALTLPTSPSGLAITASKIWFGDAYNGQVYALDRATFSITAGPLAVPCPTTGSYFTVNDVKLVQGDVYAACSNDTGGILSRLDANTGSVRMQTDAGPIAVSFAETGDGRIAIVSGGDNKLRLVTIKSSALTTAEAYTFNDLTTSILQDVHARGQFLFTAASGSNTVQKLDLTRSGPAMLVGEANVGINASPFTIVPLDDDQALVANQSGNNLVSVGADCTGGRVCWVTPK